MVVLNLKKDIEYLSKHFESEMENFSFEKNAIAAGVAMATAGGLLGPVGVLGAAVTLKFGKKGILGKIFTKSGHSGKKDASKKATTDNENDNEKYEFDTLICAADNGVKNNEDDYDDWINGTRDERGYFYQKIMEYCEKKNIDEVDMYKKAKLNRSIFSKIRSMGKTGYSPSKSTVLCICLALELSEQEAIELLEIVGYSLSDKMIIDKIVGWCLRHNQFDIFKINNLIYDKTGESYFSLNFSSSY